MRAAGLHNIFDWSTHLKLTGLLTITLFALILVPIAPPAQAGTSGIVNDFFKHTWERTDLHVARGEVARSWMWGPEPVTGQAGEPYADAPGGTRLVQYFDKSRMEVNDPNHDPNDLWYVTNGLLVRELISGELQNGDDSFVDVGSANVNVAGDLDDTLGPTYSSFLSHLGDAPRAEGAPVDSVIDRPGNVVCCVEDDYGVVAGPLAPETNHRVASVFWDFLNADGKIIEDGRRTRGALFANPYYATGYPIAEAHWANVAVAGERQWVLVQPFERRVLTYTPGNAPEWRVEMGNVGLHYLTWRYGDEPSLSAPPGWDLPAYPVPPIPDGQRVAIPHLEARYELHLLEADVDTGAVVAHEEIHVDAIYGERPETLYLQVVPAEYGYFSLDSITVDGEPVDVESQYGGLTLAVSLPASASVPFTVELDFQLDVGGFPNDFIGTVLDQGVLRLGYWFPIVSDAHGYSLSFDPSQSRAADFSVTLDIDSAVVVAHTGYELSREGLGDGRTRYHLEALDVRDFALALSRDFAVEERTGASGVEIRVLTLPGNAGRNDTIFAAAEDAIVRMGQLLGPYPYSSYDIVDVGPNMPGGLEFPNLIYINTEYGELARLIYHETAHQWLYGIIGNRTLIDGWIDEGGAEFFERGLPSGFTEIPTPPAEGYLYWLDSNYEELPVDASRQWYYSIYEQGARFCYALLDWMGWDAFWRAFSTVYVTHIFGIVTPHQFLATFQEFSATDLRPLYDDYFRYPWVWDLLAPGG